MRIINTVYLFKHKGYIAGTGDGLVSVGNKPASRKIYVLDTQTLTVIKTATSLDNGHYLITNLNPTKRYLVMARDYQGEYEPVCYDNVVPAADLSLDELVTLWRTMTGRAMTTG